MNPLRIFLLAALILTVWSSTEAESGDPSLEYVGNYDTIGIITISGNYAYVAGTDGLEIINIEDPANPTFVGSCDIDGAPYRVTISGNYAYVAGTDGLEIINIEDKTNPTLAGKYDNDTTTVRDVAISGNYAYLAVYGALKIVDIEDLTNPTLAGIYSGGYTGAGVYTSVTISGNYAYTIIEERGQDKGGRLYILNIEDPVNLTFVGSYESTDPELGPEFGGYVKAVTVSGNYAYVNIMNNSGDYYCGAHESELTNPHACRSKFVILNIEDLSNPTFVGSYEFLGDHYAERISISGNYAYCSYRWLGVVIVNIEDPTNPTFAGSYDDGVAGDLAISGDYVYVSDYAQEEERLVILRITDAGEDEEGIPSISLIPALISIGLLAIFRRK